MHTRWKPAKKVISTHDLTRRSTLPPNSWTYTQGISTHDLTRRSTLTWLSPFWVIKFQLTTSQGGRQIYNVFLTHTGVFQLTTSQGGRLICLWWPIVDGYFNSRPHKEVDDYWNCLGCKPNYFNSRPHKEVDAAKTGKMPLHFTFQLTTSQGGRR